MPSYRGLVGLRCLFLSNDSDLTQNMITRGVGEEKDV